MNALKALKGKLTQEVTVLRDGSYVLRIARTGTRRYPQTPNW